MVSAATADDAIKVAIEAFAIEDPHLQKQLAVQPIGEARMQAC